MRNVTVRSDGSGLGSNWYLSWISVNGERANVNRWIEDDESVSASFGDSLSLGPSLQPSAPDFTESLTLTQVLASMAFVVFCLIGCIYLVRKRQLLCDFIKKLCNFFCGCLVCICKVIAS